MVFGNSVLSLWRRRPGWSGTVGLALEPDTQNWTRVDELEEEAPVVVGVMTTEHTLLFYRTSGQSHTCTV